MITHKDARYKVVPLAFGGANIVRINSVFREQEWRYESTEAALQALFEFLVDAELTEPSGWIHHAARAPTPATNKNDSSV